MTTKHFAAIIEYTLPHISLKKLLIRQITHPGNKSFKTYREKYINMVRKISVHVREVLNLRS